jgi:hypothetical protein
MSLLTGAKKIGTEAQAPPPPDTSPKLDAKGIKHVQQIVGSFLYYAWAINMTVLKTLSSIAVEQTKASEKTMARCTQLLDYLLHNVDAKVRFHASDMVLNIHSNASYLLKAQAQSHACGHFFMERTPKNEEPIRLNGAFHVSLTIMGFVVMSAAEAKLGALHHNCQTGMIFRLAQKEMGHPQPKTPVRCNNATAVGIATNFIKQQHPYSMEMQFFWVGGKMAQGMSDISWHSRMENLVDYQSKHHLGSHHVNVRPWYLHVQNSPQYSPRAQSQSTLKGCVRTLDGGYVCNIPLL